MHWKISAITLVSTMSPQLIEIIAKASKVRTKLYVSNLLLSVQLLLVAALSSVLDRRSRLDGAAQTLIKARFNGERAFQRLLARQIKVSLTYSGGFTVFGSAR